MSDPLSSVASVLTIIGSATESIKVLVTFFRQFRHAPARVHQWLTMLESLCSTLSSLELHGRNLDPRFRFSSHFQQRLLSCVNQLQICTSEIARIDIELVEASLNGKKKWEHKARRSWESAKWAIVGDYKMKRVIEIMNFFHFEFVVELLKVLISIESTIPPPPNRTVRSRFGPLQQQQSTGPEDQPELPRRRLFRSASTLIFHPSEGNGITSTPIPRRNSFPAAVEYTCLDPRPAPAIPIFWSHQLVKPAVSIYLNFMTCRFMLRAGPIIKLRSNTCGTSISRRYQEVGLGLILSIYPPQYLRSSLGLVLCVLQVMVVRRTKTPLHWSLDFPKTVSPDAEIFKSARAGLTENVKRLLSLDKASAKYKTTFGTTLLHSASQSGNIELIRLLIQEGADVNAQDEDGDSPLHSAMARSDNYDIARILIENGAELSSQAVDGKTPMHNIFNNTVSRVLMRDNWLEHILPDSEGMSISHFLAWSSKSTPEIFQRGCSIDDADLLSVDDHGRTCLHFAASRGNLKLLSYLIGQVSLEDMERKDNQGRTPLHYAAESSRAAGVIDTLIARGCNIYAVDDMGRTALHWAARQNNFKAVKKIVAVVGERTLLLSDMTGRMPSREVCPKRAPALYRYLRDLESPNEQSHEKSDVMPLRRGWAKSGADLQFSLVLKIVGILALILMMLLGTPD